ncbi:MAG: peptidyl-prolyl cis-trans isomerase D [Motiliproteus sp.]|jgi:peptidyl-prolyl cis-trans isomerase D
MLQNLRESSQGIIAKTIVGFIIVTFALWGVDSLFGLASAPGAPVTVNDVDISEAEIQNGIERQRRQLINQMGADVDPSMLEDNLLRGMVVEGLIEQSLLLQSAEQQGLAVSTQMLDQIILKTREFQVEGQFDRNQFNGVLRNAGLTPMMYRGLLRKELLMEQVRSAIAATAFVLPAEIKAIAAIDQQTRDIRFQLIPLQQMLAGVTVSEAEIQDYYQANQAGFMSEERLALDYIQINRSDLAADVEIDAAELQTQYQQLVAGFEGRDARDAAHILIALSAERDAEQAKTEAQVLRQKLNEGANFADLAQEYSDDGGSAVEGGSLGLVEQGVMVPEFEQALFALQVGEVSEPVETEFGYHLIKLNRIDKSAAPDFDSVRVELETAQREQKSEALFVELSEALADLSFSASDLQEPSEQLDLPISHTALMGREGGEDAFSADPRVLKAAFAEDVLSNGHNSELIELSRDQVVVIRLRQHLPASAQSLAEVREQILGQLKQQKAEQQVQARAEILLAEAKGLSQAQLEVSPWLQQDGVSRSDAVLDPLQIRALFKMVKPAAGQLSWAQVTLSDGSAAVMGVTAVYPGAELEPQALQAMTGYLANRNGQSDYVSLKLNLKSSAAIVR